MVKRVPALDGLRGLAIALVVGSHLNVLPTAFLGPPGVTLFFVLSGFLITSLLRSEHHGTGRIDLPRFWGRRALRLLPALVVAEVLIGLWWVMAGRAPAEYWSQAWPMLFYVANFTLDIHHLGVFAIGWSLAVEEQFYVVWPLALLLLRRLSARSVVGLILAVTTASILLRLALVDHPAVAYGSLPTNAFALMLGAVLTWVPNLPRATRAALRAGSLVGLIWLTARWGVSWTTNVTGTVPAAFLSAGLVLGCRQGSWMAELAPLRYLGRISYALYLWHGPILYLTAAAETPTHRVPALVASMIAAIASTHLLEEPVRRRWAGLVRARHPRTPAAAGPPPLDVTDGTAPQVV